MSKYRYRIKTKYEFIKEFGNDWRGRVRESFPIDMDYLLGQIIDPKYYSDYLIDGQLQLKSYTTLYVWRNQIGGLSWSISKDMIKEVLVTPQYNNKRKLIYE